MSPSPTPDALGQAVRELRELRGLTQTQLADGMQSGRTYVSAIENGLRNPTLTVIARLAEVLGVKTSELIADAESPRSRTAGRRRTR
jgi:transcriptional regulator with XRE-family HTH domain